jgi:PAS domain S-box-containing protein
MRWSLGTKVGLVLLAIGLAAATILGALAWPLVDVHGWRRSFLLSGLGVALALVGVGWALRASVLRSVREARDGARRILSGDLAHRVRVRSGDELGELADALNRVAASLGRLQSEGQQARSALAALDHRHRRLLDRNLAGVLFTTLDGAAVEGNEALARMLGYDSPAEVASLGAGGFPFGVSRGEALSARLREEKSLVHVDVEGTRKDGSPIQALANLTLVEDGEGAPLVEAVLLDVTPLKQAEETVRSLLRISETLNSRLDVDELLDDLVREATSLVDAEGGWAGLRTPEGMTIRKALVGAQETVLPYSWPAGRGLAGRLIDDPAPYLTNDAASDPLVTRELAERFSIRSALAVPILDAHGEVIGFFEIHNRRAGGGFSFADQDELVAVSRIVSIAIQNALAYRKVLRADEALRESEQRYRDLVENANDIIFTRDLAGNFTSFNRAAERVTGFRREEALKMNIAQITAPDSPRTAPLPSRGADGGPAPHDLEIVARDGRRVALEVSTRLLYEDGRPVGVQGIARDVTERKRAERTLRELSGHLLRLRDTERRRIARELHDSTAQSLAALAMNLARVKEAGGALDPSATRALGESLELAASCSREIRTLSYLLHPPLLDELGLAAALRWYADGFAERSGIEVALEVAPELGRLHQEVELALFRVVQESLTNIHRHSGSSRASIHVLAAASEVVLRVVDEGRGLPLEVATEPEAALAGVGVGIAGMRERIRQLGGRMEIRSGGEGTTVEAALPFLRSAS